MASAPEFQSAIQIVGTPRPKTPTVGWVAGLALALGICGMIHAALDTAAVVYCAQWEKSLPKEFDEWGQATDGAQLKLLRGISRLFGANIVTLLILELVRFALAATLTTFAWRTWHFEPGANSSLANLLLAALIFLAADTFIGYRLNTESSKLFLDYQKSAREWAPSGEPGRPIISAADLMQAAEKGQARWYLFQALKFGFFLLGIVYLRNPAFEAAYDVASHELARSRRR